ncbi:hypothetical protein C0992_003637 [Termitomyces sp. T32_za158]|nr:hypothetical protein C0992_003637 [Termitomyces sp. T32_za158]
MRHQGCTNPNKCGRYARALMGKLGPKWHPDSPISERILTEAEKDMLRGGKGEIFDPELVLKNEIGDGFRILLKEKTQRKDNQIDYTRCPEALPDPIEIYTDGSCFGNGTIGAKAGAGVWFGHEDPRNRAMRLPETIPQTNNTGEAMAMLVATKIAPLNQSIKIMSDSQLVIDAVTKNLKKNEDNGWIGFTNGQVMRSLVTNLKKRKGITILEKVKGHDGVRGNEEADRLAGLGAEKDTPNNIDMEIQREWDLPGAKLSKLTQALAYKGIIEKKNIPERRGTKTHLDMTRWAVKDTNGELPTDERIWTSLRHKALS